MQAALLGPRRPLSTPASTALEGLDWLGVASGSSRGFADFDGIQRRVSIPVAQIDLSPLRLPISPPGHSAQVYPGTIASGE
jgi:hypothetical protein